MAGRRQGGARCAVQGRQGDVARQPKVGQAAAFAANLLHLEQLGLNKQALAGLATAGAAQGAAAAQALADAGAQAVADVNYLQGQLRQSAMDVAALGSEAFYDAGVQSMKGLAAGFKSQRQVIEDEMLKIAKTMKRAIKKALGIESRRRCSPPSGVKSPLAWHSASTRGTRTATASIGRMADAMVGGPFGTGSGTVAAGHTINVYEAQGETDSAAIMRGFAQAEALTFSPA